MRRNQVGMLAIMVCGMLVSVTKGDLVGDHISIPANGEVVDGSDTHNDFPPENAFNGSTSDSNRWLPSQSDMPSYVTWRFADGNVYVVQSYRIMGQGFNTSDRSPKDHQLLGSNDGENWTVVHEVEDIPTVENNTWVNFTVDSPGAFEYYKFNVLEWGGSDTYGGLREIEFYGEVGSLGSWLSPGVSNITATTAEASAVTEVALDEAKLLWGTTDQGIEDPEDWTEGTLSLGPQAAEATASGQMTDLAADTFYTLRFYGEHGVDETEWSTPLTFATALTAAQTPVFTSAVATTPFTVELEWEDNAITETGYILQRSDSGSGGPYETIATLTANSTSYLDASAQPETTYHYRLAAVNEDNGSSTDPAACQTSATTGEGADETIFEQTVSNDWNQPDNWSEYVPRFSIDAIIASNTTANVNDSNTPEYDGDLTLQENATLDIANNVPSLNALGGGTITFHSGSSIVLRHSSNFSISQDLHFPEDGAIGNSSNATDNQWRRLDGEISGNGTFTYSMRRGNVLYIDNSNPDWSGAFVANNTDIVSNRSRVWAESSGAFGSLATITINNGLSLVIDASDTIDAGTSLYLNGGGHPSDAKLRLNQDAQVFALYIDDERMPDGQYDSSEEWITGSGSLTVQGAPQGTIILIF